VSQKITEIWAWVVEEPDGGEGIPAAFIPELRHLTPLLGSDEARVRSLQVLARSAAAVAGYPLKLVRFTHLEVLERYEPGALGERAT
jgi:hypothetical protein